MLSTSRCADAAAVGDAAVIGAAPMTGRHRPRGVRGTALVLGVGVLLGGCTSGPGTASPSPSASAPLPCAEDGSHAELGATRRGEAHAEFTTAGGTVHVAVRYFPRGGLFESDGGQAAVYVGDAATPPTYDEQTGVVSGVTAETSVREGAWGELELEPGRYWIWVSNGSDVVVAGCEPGSVTEPAPAAAEG